nr:hypothetical protein Iba_chr14bCG17830 [Ipomoea batatas]
MGIKRKKRNEEREQQCISPQIAAEVILMDQKNVWFLLCEHPSSGQIPFLQAITWVLDRIETGGVWDQNRGVQAETLQIGGDDCPQTQSAEMLTLLRVPKFKPTGLSYHF